MGQDPGEIREEIEDTRARMGETVEAIGYKTDVKSRASDKVSGTIESVKSKVGGANDATPGRESVWMIVRFLAESSQIRKRTYIAAPRNFADRIAGSCSGQPGASRPDGGPRTAVRSRDARPRARSRRCRHRRDLRHRVPMGARGRLG